MTKRIAIVTLVALFLGSCSKPGTWGPFRLSYDKEKAGEITQIDLGSIKYIDNKMILKIRFLIPEKDQFVVTTQRFNENLAKQCIGRKATALLAVGEVDCATRQIAFIDALAECGDGISMREEMPPPVGSKKREPGPPVPPDMEGDWFKYCKKSYEIWK